MIYSVLPSFVLGFHGCDQSVARDVVLGKCSLKHSDNQYDWLGSGIYFWENSPKRALEWAQQIRGRGKIRRPAVIGAIIDLGNCLNLLDSRFVQTMREAYQFLIEATRESAEVLPKNRPLRGSQDLLLRDLDCAVINAVHAKAKVDGLRPYDTVRSAFIEGSEIYPNSAFKDQNHIQICVRTIHCIKGYFYPLEEIS